MTITKLEYLEDSSKFSQNFHAILEEKLGQWVDGENIKCYMSIT